MRGKQHSEETRAAVMAALLTGQGVSEIATAYKLPHSTVSRWARALGPQLDEVGPKKAEAIGDLITNYLGEVLVTLSVQAVAFRDPAWLKEQPANEVAVLHGVLADKAIRILAALEPDADPGADTETAEGA